MTTSTRRAETISNIVAKRNPLVQKIQTVQYNLNQVASRLSGLERMAKSVGQESEPELVERLQALQFRSLLERIKEEQEGLDKLKSRYARRTLNIGVIGRARQGKSRLLQSLSGLGPEVIPSGNRQNCTGVRSTIYNNPGGYEETRGEVTFYSEREFFDEVIGLYYDKLALGAAPQNAQEFMRGVPNLPSSKQSTRLKAMHSHLMTYWEKFNEYKHLLGQGRMPIGEKDIRHYVAQDTQDGQRIYFNYLAVKEVKIYCNFPYSDDVGQIALIDMPGLGDTNLGDAERMVQALGEDIDVILFVRMPQASGDNWSDYDMDLYDLPATALSDLQLGDWSFMILNHRESLQTEEDNLKNCEDFRDALLSNEPTSPGSHIKVVDCIIANCANAEEVGEHVLDRVLNYLVQNINLLDNAYASSRQKRLDQLQREIREELTKARQAWSSATANDTLLFEKLFKKLWDQLTAGLEKTVSELSAKRATQDPRFKQYFDSRFDAYMNTSNIPSIDEIEQRRHRVGSYDIIYNEYLHEIRTQLTHQFFLLDDALESPMEDIKQKVALVLAEQGRLRHMTTTEGSRFFTTVAEKIPVDRKKLKEVFQAFATFRLSYRGFFQYRIRMNLDALTPDRTAYRFAPVNSTNNDRRQPANAAPNQPNMTNARQVQNGLATIQKQTVAELRKTLNDYLVEPSQAAFAITEEFVDQLLRAKDARDDLAAFYRDVHIEVWPDEFRNIYTWQQLQRQWRTLIDEANSFNELSNSRFSN